MRPIQMILGQAPKKKGQLPTSTQKREIEWARRKRWKKTKTREYIRTNDG